MIQFDLPSLRKLALNGQIDYTPHSLQQKLSRGYLTADVEKLLTSPTNQIIEIQSPSTTPGREHKDHRYVISDPNFIPETAVVVSIVFSNSNPPTIVVVTIEKIDNAKWNKQPGKNPWLVRK